MQLTRELFGLATSSLPPARDIMGFQPKSGTVLHLRTCAPEHRSTGTAEHRSTTEHRSTGAPEHHGAPEHQNGGRSATELRRTGK